MTDFDSSSLDLSEPEAPEVSTQLDEGRPSETSQAKPAPDEGEKKPESRMDAIKRAAEDLEKAQPKAEEKPAEEKPEAKEQPKEEGNDQAEQKPATDEKPEPKQKPFKDMSEEERKAAIERMTPEQRRRYEQSQIQAPDKFIPSAKDVWRNVPGEVKGEIARVLKEHESEIQGAREFIAPLVKYHQMAQQSGTTLDQALDRYVKMEQALRQDPAHGFRALLENMEMQPQEAIAQILRAFNVNPQQLAEHMAQQPHAYMAQAPRQPQQKPEDPRVGQLQEQLAQERANTLRTTVIEPFAASHPRYAELERDIAFFLQSGRIPQSLSLNERLEVAYDMAARINPASNVSEPSARDDGLAPQPSRVATDLSGSKSVRGAPSSGVDTPTRRKRNMSRGEAIEAAMAELGIS
ncbi:hypothetical protein [Sphingobium sp. DC-2]|uniref:hypothetical protein n=1 Tax=Sphingobium sp. DC-2 TaxID=1303256 RepID=UPI0006923C47|nr:hypothetical protein [Sphingobium sp. DC-2]